MWKIKRIDTREFLINLEYCSVDAIQKILVTDLQNLWLTELSDKQILDIFKKLNPLVEAEEENLKCEIRRIFDAERIDVCWNYEIQDDELKLNMKTTTSWLPLSFCASLKVADNESYFQIIVLPLLVELKNNRKQINHLCDIIEKKDQEIEEYLMNGTILTRKAVMTPRFDRNMLHNVFEENLKTIFASISENYLDRTVHCYWNKVNKIADESKSRPILTQVEDEPTTEEIKVKQKPKNENSASELPVRKKPKIVKKLKNL